MHRQSQTHICNEKEFIDQLDESFDIFPKSNYHHNEEMKLETEDVKCEIEQVQQEDEHLNTDDFDMFFESDEESTDFRNDSDFEMTLPKYQQFTMLCAAISGGVGENLDECTLSTSTCYRRKKNIRGQIATTIKGDYMSSAKSNLVLHWDGKKLPDTTNENLELRKKKVERLAIVVSGVEIFFNENTYISSLRDDIISYVGTILTSENKKCDLKGDHLEMLELCLIVLRKPMQITDKLS